MSMFKKDLVDSDKKKWKDPLFKRLRAANFIQGIMHSLKV